MHRAPRKSNKCAADWLRNLRIFSSWRNRGRALLNRQLVKRPWKFFRWGNVNVIDASLLGGPRVTNIFSLPAHRRARAEKLRRALAAIRIGRHEHAIHVLANRRKPGPSGEVLDRVPNSVSRGDLIEATVDGPFVERGVLDVSALLEGEGRVRDHGRVRALVVLRRGGGCEGRDGAEQ